MPSINYQYVHYFLIQFYPLTMQRYGMLRGLQNIWDKLYKYVMSGNTHLCFAYFIHPFHINNPSDLTKEPINSVISSVGL